MMMAAVALFATTAFAQDDLVKQAKKLCDKGELEQAATTLTPALTSDQTEDKAEAWNLMGDIQYQLYMKSGVPKSTIGNMKYGPTENILISDCTLISTSAALKIGTEGSGNFRNIMMQNCIISNSNRGISVQIRDGGNVENVSFQNIMIHTRRFAKCWWGCAEPIAISVADRDENTHAGKVSGIRFFNITCDSENGVFVHGMPENHVEDVLFEKVQVTMSARSKWARGQYDLRPGLGTGIIERKSPGFFPAFFCLT